MEIIKATIKDSTLIYENIKQCADNMQKEGLNHWIPYYPLESIQKDIEEKLVYIVKEENKVIGNFILTINKEENKIYLGKLAIIPEYEGRGFGSKCLYFIENFAKKNKFKKIELDVYDKSTNTINFYIKNGYKIIGEKKTRRFIVVIMDKEME